MTGGGIIASLTLHDMNADVTMPGAGAAGGDKPFCLRPQGANPPSGVG